MVQVGVENHGGVLFKETATQTNAWYHQTSRTTHVHFHSEYTFTALTFFGDLDLVFAAILRFKFLIID